MFVFLQPIAPHQRPTVAVNILEDGVGYKKGMYPADVVCVVQMKTRTSTGPSDSGSKDMALVQYYDYVLGEGQRCHSQVPGCWYVYLTDTFSFVDVALLEYPVKLVPEIAPHLAPAIAARLTSSADTDRVQRPPFFWMPELL